MIRTYRGHDARGPVFSVWLGEKLPSLRSGQFKVRDQRILGLLIRREQQKWLGLLHAADAVNNIRYVQEQAAARKHRVAVKVVVARKPPIRDYKNMVRAVDEFLIDPLVRVGALYDDSDNCINLKVKREECSSDLFDGGPWVFVGVALDENECAEWVVKRWRKNTGLAL